MLRCHHRDVVQPVHVWERLLVIFVLDELLGATVQQADVRVSTGDRLTAELQHQAQHAVRSWVLRAKVQGEVFYLKVLLLDQLTLHLCPLVGLSEERERLTDEATRERWQAADIAARRAPTQCARSE